MKTKSLNSEYICNKHTDRAHKYICNEHELCTQIKKSIQSKNVYFSCTKLSNLNLFLYISCLHIEYICMYVCI